MSFNLRSIREISNDPLSKFVSHLAKKISDLANQDDTTELENKEDIYSAGQDVDTVVKFHTLTSTKQFTFTLPYYPPFEPDLDTNKIWLQGRSMANDGNTGTKPMRDLSGFNNTTWISGDPILLDGTPFNYGIHTGGTKSIALRFNRVDGAGLNHEEEYREHIGISEDADIAMYGSQDISFFFRVRPLSTNLDQGKRRTIYIKTDQEDMVAGNGGNTNGARFSIDPVNDRLVIQIKRGGAFQSKETAINKFQVGNVYDFFITYEQNTGQIKLYLAKTGDSTMTDETLTNSSYTEEWGNTPSDLSARLFKRGPGSNDGAFHGDFFDFKVYRNKLISQTEANNHWTNKWTIYNIPFGQVMISDYYSDYEDALTISSFTPISFTATSWTTTALGSMDSYTSTSYTSTSYT